MRLLTMIATILFSMSATAGNRMVSSMDDVDRKVDRWDYERLSGYFENQAREKKFEVDRLLGVDELKAKRLQEEKAQDKALADYKVQMQKNQRPSNDEEDPLYKAYLKEEALAAKEREVNREKYIDDRDQLQRNGKVAPVSEAQELNLADNRERVDWRYRALYGGSSGKPIRSRGSSILSPPSRQSPPRDFSPMEPGGFVPPMTDENSPVFDGAEPEVFDEDIPPPPPPPEGFDEMVPPPPPMLDDTEF